MNLLTSVLLCTGILFLLGEIFIPGFGVMGTLGILCTLIASLLIMLYQPFGFIIVSGLTVSIILAIFYFIRKLKKKQFANGFILSDTLMTEQKEFGDLDYFLGREGITVTPLKPFGTADFNGVTLEVFSNGPYVKKNSRIKVIKIESNKIIVQEQESGYVKEELKCRN